jgi:hypothetical protein
MATIKKSIIGKSALIIAFILLSKNVNAIENTSELKEQTFGIFDADLNMNAFMLNTNSADILGFRSNNNNRPNKTGAIPYKTANGTYLYGLSGGPKHAIKTNMLHDITTSLNIGGEFKLSRQLTLDVPLTYNPWTYNKEENTKFKFLLVQPELRYWTCEAFNGQFFGLHAHWAYYNVGHLKTPPFTETMHKYRFEGQLAGAGISYGYRWYLGTRWNLEAEIGAGYARLWYDKFPCQTCAKLITREHKNYWGLTRAGVSLIYLFK